jgi:hypothetical protein
MKVVKGLRRDIPNIDTKKIKIIDSKKVLLESFKR